MLLLHPKSVHFLTTPAKCDQVVSSLTKGICCSQSREDITSDQMFQRILLSHDRYESRPQQFQEPHNKSILLVDRPTNGDDMPLMTTRPESKCWVFDNLRTRGFLGFDGSLLTHSGKNDNV
jgi:hypothetical protein